MKTVIVTGSFDDLRSKQVRFLQEASRLGQLHILLWSDQAVQALNGKPPRFPLTERQYFLQSLRYVHSVEAVEPQAPHELAGIVPEDNMLWAVPESEHHSQKTLFSASFGLGYQVVPDAALVGFPELLQAAAPAVERKKVLVTGCFDWLHSGHVRFFEEVSELGRLYVVVGHDENLRLLKGDGHPMYPQDERRYMVQAVRYVHQALIASGQGWLDAEPEIQRLKPDIYVVNEDGDRPEKRRYCQEQGIDYRVLKRAPKEGLPARQSTVLRGF